MASDPRTHRGRNRVPVEERFHFHVSPEPNSGCHLWTAATYPNGYGQVGVNGRMQLAHRVAWELANGPIPDGLFVCHRCDVRACVNPDHLFLGTRRQNVDDMLAKKRHVHGAKHPCSKLSENVARAIKAATGKQLDIARAFGVQRSVVCRIKSGDRWGHLEEVNNG
jgi:hypothetical protein